MGVPQNKFKKRTPTPILQLNIGDGVECKRVCTFWVHLVNFFLVKLSNSQNKGNHMDRKIHKIPLTIFETTFVNAHPPLDRI